MDEEREHLDDLITFRAKVGDYVIFTWRGQPLGGVVRWMNSNAISIQLGLPDRLRAELGMGSPTGYAVFTYSR